MSRVGQNICRCCTLDLADAIMCGNDHALDLPCSPGRNQYAKLCEHPGRKPLPANRMQIRPCTILTNLVTYFVNMTV